MIVFCKILHPVFTCLAMGVTILSQTPCRQKCQEEMVLFLHPTGWKQQRCHSDTSIRALRAQWRPAEESNPASLQMVPLDNCGEGTLWGGPVMTWWLTGMVNCTRNRQPHPMWEHTQSKKLSNRCLSS